MTRAIIAAVGSETRLMGRKDQDGNYHLPWKPREFKEDMEFFVEHTTGGIVLLGPKTYDSIPKQFRPFKNRTTLVVSRSTHYALPEGEVDAPLYHMTSIEGALEWCKRFYAPMPVWCAGGPEFCAAFMPFADELLFTRFKESTLPERPYGELAFFPEIEKEVWVRDRTTFHIETSNGILYWHERWVRK